MLTPTMERRRGRDILASTLLFALLLFPTLYADPINGFEMVDVTKNGWRTVGSAKNKGKRRLKIGIPIPSPGYERLMGVKVQEGTPVIDGFCIEAFSNAVKLLDYDIEYDFVPFRSKLQEDQMAGTYNDLLYKVYLGVFDGVVGDVSISADRAKYVDFTVTFTDMGVGMVAKGEKGNDLWIFLKPLSTNLWIASACFFILTGVVVWLIEHPTNHDFQCSHSQQIGTVLWFSFSTLVYAHRERVVSNLSKLVMIVWLFLVFILTSSYTATLASMLTVKQLQLNPKESYIGTQRAGRVISNLNFKDFRLKPYSSPQDIADALSKGSKNGGVSAIVDEIPYIKAFLSRFANQGFFLVGTTSPITNGFGFAFPKGSALAGDMSRAIMKLREEGTLKAIEDKWFAVDKSPFSFDKSSTDNNNPSVLTFENFRGLFFISGTTSALALLIFLLFHIHKMHHLIREFGVMYWIQVGDFIVKSCKKIVV